MNTNTVQASSPVTSHKTTDIVLDISSRDIPDNTTPIAHIMEQVNDRLGFDLPVAESSYDADSSLLSISIAIDDLPKIDDLNKPSKLNIIEDYFTTLIQNSINIMAFFGHQDPINGQEAFNLIELNTPYSDMPNKVADAVACVVFDDLHGVSNIHVDSFQLTAV